MTARPRRPPLQIIRQEPADIPVAPAEDPPPAPRALVARDSAAEQVMVEERPIPQPEPEQTAHQALEQTPLQVIGVAFHTYIIALHGDSLLLIDQHALHERLLFDRMMARQGEAQDVQTLLSPG